LDQEALSKRLDDQLKAAKSDLKRIGDELQVAKDDFKNNQKLDVDGLEKKLTHLVESMDYRPSLSELRGIVTSVQTQMAELNAPGSTTFNQLVGSVTSLQEQISKQQETRETKDILRDFKEATVSEVQKISTQHKTWQEQTQMDNLSKQLESSLQDLRRQQADSLAANQVSWEQFASANLRQDVRNLQYQMYGASLGLVRKQPENEVYNKEATAKRPKGPTNIYGPAPAYGSPASHTASYPSNPLQAIHQDHNQHYTPGTVTPPAAHTNHTSSYQPPSYSSPSAQPHTGYQTQPCYPPQPHYNNHPQPHYVGSLPPSISLTAYHTPNPHPPPHHQPYR
jgi:hypothetical protein